MNRIKLDPTWHSRRQVVRLTLLSCLVMSLYSLWRGPELVAVAFPYLASVVVPTIGSYVFGSSWERVNGIASLNTHEVKE